jgi:hypothetical protein
MMLPEKLLKQNSEGGMAQVVEYLPSKEETLSSSPDTTKI